VGCFLADRGTAPDLRRADTEHVREHRVVLHGQFFVDAGRRGIADYERLHAPREDLPRHASQQLVLQHWNQALAQEVVLPEFLPALDAYARANGLRDEELTALTGAIVKVRPEGESGATGFFNSFAAHICRQAAWVRSLSTGVQLGPWFGSTAPGCCRYPARQCETTIGRGARCRGLRS
jgi:hypothetical protein